MIPEEITKVQDETIRFLKETVPPVDNAVEYHTMKAYIGMMKEPRWKNGRFELSLVEGVARKTLISVRIDNPIANTLLSDHIIAVITGLLEAQGTGETMANFERLPESEQWD